MSLKQSLQFLKKSKFNPQKAKQYQKAYNKIKQTNLFDEKFYLEQYPNVANSNIDPLTHYLFYGGNEGKYPSTNFNGNQYLNQNPELIKTQTNPLVHYILEGQKQNKKIFKVNYHQQKNKILKNNQLYLHNYKITEEPLVSIIILNHNGQHHLKRLFKNFKTLTNYNNYEIIIVDNNSTDNSIKYLETLNLPIKIIKNNTNESYSHANNQAAKIAKGKLLLLLNNDIEPTQGWLNELVGTLQKHNATAVGAKLIYPYYFDRVSNNKSFTIQHAKVKFTPEINEYYDYGPIHENIEDPDIFNHQYNKTTQCLAVTAACLLIKKETYLKLGGLDEDYHYGYEDVDLMLKLYKNNHKTIYNGAALLFHHESSTRNTTGTYTQLNIQNIKTLMKKWETYLFKKILLDKIQEKKFFTNQKLKIAIINTNHKHTNMIKKLVKEINKNNYNLELIINQNIRHTDKETDIIISTDPEYPIHKLRTRKHTIKILYTENTINMDYNIILTNNKNIINNENTFPVENLNLKNILDTIKKIYNI